MTNRHHSPGVMVDTFKCGVHHMAMSIAWAHLPRRSACGELHAGTVL